MKKLIIILSCILLTINSIGQINFEYSYPNGKLKTTIIKLSNSGLKYQWVDVSTGQIKLYNLDHTIFKTMSFPVLAGMTGVYVAYVSENTFDTDNEIEYMVYYQDDFNWVNSATKIVNENGTIILDKVGEIPAFSMTGDEIAAIFNTPNGTKMILDSYNDNSAKVYSLPGTLVATNLKNVENNFNNSLFAFPNPANTYIKMAYTLPANIKEANVSIFDVEGKLVKVYTIDHNFNELLIETDNWNSGIYFCQINSNGKNISTTEFVVRK